MTKPKTVKPKRQWVMWAVYLPNGDPKSVKKKLDDAEFEAMLLYGQVYNIKKVLVTEL